MLLDITSSAQLRADQLPAGAFRIIYQHEGLSREHLPHNSDMYIHHIEEPVGEPFWVFIPTNTWAVNEYGPPPMSQMKYHYNMLGVEVKGHEITDQRWQEMISTGGRASTAAASRISDRPGGVVIRDRSRSRGRKEPKEPKEPKEAA